MNTPYSTVELSLSTETEASDDRPSVGLVVLTTDMTTERDFAALTQRHRLKFNQYVNRITFCNPITVENLYAMLEELGGVAEQIVPAVDLDAVVFCCTSASAIIGDHAIEAAISKVKSTAEIITTAKASVSMLRRHGHRRIKLLTPYDKNVSCRLADYFEENGLEISSLHYMDIADDRDVARLSSDYILQAAQATADPSADCRFISCTAMRVVEIRQQLQESLKQPVFSSNYATFWETMSRIGLNPSEPN